MKSVATIVAASLLLAGPAGAVNCINNIPPSNPDSAYTASGDGTVTDTRNGLMWKVCAEGQVWSAGACTGSATAVTWDMALSQAEASAYAGYSDWRLPNVKELRSLVEECRYSPAINDVVFPGVPSRVGFWTGSPVANSSEGWFVEFDFGVSTPSGVRNISGPVRFVRGGQSANSSVFAVSASAFPGVAFTSPYTNRSASCVLAATGSWNNGPTANYGPDGASGSTCGSTCRLPSAPSVALIMMRSDGSGEFLGSSRSVSLAAAETVTFSNNDGVTPFQGHPNAYFDNQGSMNVTVLCN